MKHSVIVYGSLEGVEKTALRHLSEILLDETGEYPTCVPCNEWQGNEQWRCFFIGTRENNPFLRREKPAPCQAEGYCFYVEQDTVYIEGADAAGVLYGCVDFYNRYVALAELTHEGDWFRNIFDSVLPDVELYSAPATKNRGLWAWGHVIYDIKGYIDNMMRLKMNTLIVWHDYAPLNAAEIVAYAHERNVKIIWGFAWLWDTRCLDTDMNSVMDKADDVVEYYEKNYASLPGDGVYFQSFTEVNVEYIGGVLVADAVVKFVNHTAGKLLEKYPELELHFGLHATSVNEKLEYIRKTDPRIRITWEDCGAFPYNYMPENVDNFEETKAFTEKIAVLRGEEERFGVVLKGLTKLDWGAFRHLQGRSYLGSSSKRKKEKELARGRDMWHFIQAGWLINADKALEMIRLMQKLTKGDMYATALAEDSMFEEKLFYPIALLGEMLWDGQSDVKDIVYRVGVRKDVEFA